MPPVGSAKYFKHLDERSTETADAGTLRGHIRVETQGIKVCESSNRGPVIPGKYAIDFTLDNTGKRHRLHPYERLRHDPRWAAIREKNRQRRR